MAVMNSHDMPLQTLRPWGGLRAAGPKFWATGAAFIAVYFALNLLTEWHEFDRLGITLWSPDDGLSLALLIESVAFAPFVFLGAVLVDVLIAGVHRSIGVTMAAELFLTIAYVALALILKYKLKFDMRQFRLPDVVAFLLFIPPGAALTSSIYCVTLYIGGEL
jgi:two-component system, LuxR family, sensor kinase FixL